MKRIHSRMLTWTACCLPLLLSAVLVAALPAAAGPGASARLESVTLTSDQGVTRLKLTSDAPVQFSDFSLADPDRIVVDCVNAHGLPTKPALGGDLVEDVSFAPLEGAALPTTRMTIALRKTSEYTIFRKQTALEVAIQPSSEKAGSAGLVETGNASRGGRVSLDVQGADVKTVLRTLATVSGHNIVPTKEVKGEVSMALRNVPWRDALDALCKSQELAYKEENGIIRVGPLEQLQNEELNARTAERKAEDLLPLESRVVHVSFANVEELKKPIESSLSKRGHVETDPRTSSLLITDIAERAEAAERLARQLDSRTPQITITAKLVDVDVASERDLGVDWGYNGTTIGTVHLAPHVHSPLTDADDIDPTKAPPGVIRIGTVGPDGNGLAFKLQALEKDNKADIISNPTITTVDNREARILVGQKIPLIVADAAGNAITQLTTIGIQLRVIPHLNSDNKITMDIHPEVSDLSSQSTVQGGVIINTSEADTRVQVDDGQTAVIGGLIRTNESLGETGVPVLKDIPLVGNLFKSSSKVHQKRDLMILVTPHLVIPGK